MKTEFKMKKLIINLGLLLLCISLYAQNNPANNANAQKTYFQNYKLNFNKTDLLEKPVDTSKMKDGEFYFLQSKKGDQIQSIAYYDNKGNIQTYVLDRYYNVYFQYITFKYEKGLLVSKEFKNASDFVLAKIDYEYDENKKIKKTTLYTYSLLQRELIKIEETSYNYQGDAYSIVERVNKQDQTYEKLNYGGKKALQEYERYDIDGKTLQYRIKYFYENNQISKKEYYSKANVLIKTIYAEKKALAKAERPQQ